mgnify:FL=1
MCCERRYSTVDGVKYWIPKPSALTLEMTYDIAKLDEMYFASNYYDLYRLDFCTVPPSFPFHCRISSNPRKRLREEDCPSSLRTARSM